jgi:hypothetical protein
LEWTKREKREREPADYTFLFQKKNLYTICSS